MEVPMLKTKRRLPQFDCLEGKVLLSAGMADPAATVHRDASQTIPLERFAVRASQRLARHRWVYRDVLSRRGSSRLDGKG